MLIGARLEKLIEERGLKRTWLSQRSGLNYTNLLKILKDQQAPTTDSVVALAKALDVSADWILGLKDEAG